jgi:hypothetical protein
MSLWSRIKSRSAQPNDAQSQPPGAPDVPFVAFTPTCRWSADGLPPAWMSGTVTGTYCGGGKDLEVVGESHYQPALQLAASYSGKPMHASVHAFLIAEEGNPYDGSAVAVWVGAAKVGHLSRDDARTLRSSIIDLGVRQNAPVVVDGTIVGGGPGRSLGIWLKYDPEAFGLNRRAGASSQTSNPPLRSGWTQAIVTDQEDDSYDLSPIEALPLDSAQRLPKLRKLLQEEATPIGRHFIMSELETTTYKLRDAFPAALDEFDATCTLHDAEMPTIRPALIEKFGDVPLLDFYRQACIRHAKAKDSDQALWWAERGLLTYGDQAHDPSWMTDLEKRAAKLRAGGATTTGV